MIRDLMQFLNFRDKWQRRLFLIFFGCFLSWTSFRFDMVLVLFFAFTVSYFIGLFSTNYFTTTINALITLISMVAYYAIIGIAIGYGRLGQFLEVNELLSHLSGAFEFSVKTLFFTAIGFPIGQISRWIFFKLSAHK